RDEIRQEIGQNNLSIKINRPVAVPDGIDELRAGQNRTIVIEDPAVGPRRTRSGWTEVVWTKCVLRRSRIQRGQDQRERHQDNFDELRVHGSSPFVMDVSD